MSPIRVGLETRQPVSIPVIDGKPQLIQRHVAAQIIDLLTNNIPNGSDL